MTDHTSIRKALVAAGLRTFAYSFDGAGDSGSLEQLLLPSQPNAPLAEHVDVRLDDAFNSSATYGNIDGEWQASPTPGYKEAYAIIESVTNAEDALHDMAYAALERFDGDWVNNDGGYGIVAVDLMTGQYRIDGYQRYMSTSSANSDGICFDDIGTDQPLDLAKHLKSTLNVS
jgi:hypothetical protein